MAETMIRIVSQRCLAQIDYEFIQRNARSIERRLI